MVCQSQDTLWVSNNLINNLSPLSHFESIDYNPSAKVFTRLQNLSDIHLKYSNLSGEAGLSQNGNKYNEYSFEANSFMNKDKHYIWGKASYDNKHTDNIIWNESSDYDNIYPYVFADTIGGNNMIGEKYSFMGGYAQRNEKISWGIEFDYWALMEYRTKDPRPNNTTSDLHLNLGANYNLLPKYAIGIGGYLRKYKQTTTIEFKNALGRKTPLYHMTGLGNNVYLFANNETGTIYDGKGYGANIQLLNREKKGINLTLGYENFSFDKQLNITQNLNLSSIKEDKLLGIVSYIKPRVNRSYGVKIEGSYTNREGTENLFTKDGNNSYVKISSIKQYTNKVADIKLSFLYEQNLTNMKWYVTPSVSLYDKKEKHKTSLNHLEVTNLSFDLNPGLIYKIKNNPLQIESKIGFVSNLSSDLKITNLEPQQTLYQYIVRDYELQSSNVTNIGLSSRYDYCITAKQMAVYAKCEWYYAKYKSEHNNLLSIYLGLTF